MSFASRTLRSIGFAALMALAALTALIAMASHAFAIPAAPPRLEYESDFLLEAKEGFTPPGHTPPAALQRAWNSVVLIKSENRGGVAQGTGSGFLVSLERKSSQIRALFLTNAHVVNELCSAGGCASIRVAHDIMLMRDGLRFIKGPNAFESPIRIIKKDDALDLALIEASLTGNEARRLQTLPVRPSCSEERGEPIFAIGHPNTFFRRHPSKSGIVRADLAAKRLSQGVLMGEIQETKAFSKTVRLLQTTADAISGNSGGPVVDASGAFSGVLLKAMATSTSSPAGDEYFGQDRYTLYRAHSFVIPCAETFNFLNNLNNK